MNKKPTPYLSPLACGLAAVLHAAASPRSEDVFVDAQAVWHFGADGISGRYPLVPHGAVTLGVELEDADREASLARGGNGQAAVFEGGYLEIGGPPFDPPEAAFTLLLRVRDPEGRWDAPLCGSYGGDAKASLYLHGVDGATLPFHDRNYTGGRLSTPAGWMFGWPEGPRAVHGSRGVVECIWGSTGVEMTPMRANMQPKNLPEGEDPPLVSDTRNAIQRVMFPMALADPCAWHDVVVRGTGAKLELWLDGVLLDEEFPVGATRPAAVPRTFGAAQTADGALLSGFNGLMDHAALWHRPLSVPEIVALCGGAEAAQQREMEILGPLAQNMQYYRSRGHNSKPGDCIPFFHNGVFHLFYLVLRRNMHSKWDGGHGGLEVHHASTRDLVLWQHHPVAIPISEQWEAWNGTGGVVHHDGTFHFFYPTPDYDGNRSGIQLATSEDGESFVKQSPHPFLPGGDCEVFADPDPQKQLFHLIKEGQVIGGKLPALQDKTLVCWLSPADMDQHGAGVLTVEGSGGRFDSLVLGEVAPRRWMAGSELLRRTQMDQQANAEETAAPGEWVQIAAVYARSTVTLYRNGTPYSHYAIEEPMHFAPGARVLLGRRHQDRRGDPAAHFRGAIADARVYPVALTDAEIATLRPHDAAGPKPLVWFDFGQGSAADRAGTLEAPELEGRAAVRDGQLVLQGGNDCLKSAGRKMTLAHWVSGDLRTWEELPEPLLVADEALVPQMCPHWFRWNDWHYIVGGVGGIWRSRQPYGPWTLQSPGHLDSLSVPKTGAFTGNRRLLAGFLSDDGWGGNLVLRELLQHADGTLGTRFVPEMIPASGEPIETRTVAGGPAWNGTSLPLAARQGKTQILFDNVPNDARITLRLAPQGAVGAYGLSLRTTDGENDGTMLRLTPRSGTASYSASTHSGSGGTTTAGPAIDGLRGIDRAVRLDIVCQHDIVDVEIDGRHTLANRFWNPRGNRFGVWVEDGTLRVTDVVIRPLVTDVLPQPSP